MNDEEIMTAVQIWMDDPVAFVEDVFGATPSEWQAKGLRKVAKSKKVAIRSGHGVGKTAYLSWLILWWLCTRHPAKVACTAPTSHQLKDVLWSEVKKWHGKMPKELRDMITINETRIEIKGLDNFAVARTARRDQPEAFQGFHSENMLFIVDEASGVEDIIFEVGQGAMSTKGAKTVMTGNPTRRSGYFFEAFHTARKFWETFKVSCEDVPTVDKDFIEEMKEKYGEDSNVYRIRVLGDFPDSEDDVVIPMHLVESAVHRDIETLSSAAVIWGLDVARFGSDRSALAKRQGNAITEPIKSWQGKDLMQLCGIVKAEYDKTHENYKPKMICVDVIGLGAGVVDRLRELGLPVYGVNVAEVPSVGKRYLKLKDDLWWHMREWFEARDVKMPEDKELIAELCTPKYNFTSNGKLKIESKDEMKKRGVASPDLAEAMMLTFAWGSDSVSDWSKPVKQDLRWIV